MSCQAGVVDPYVGEVAVYRDTGGAFWWANVTGWSCVSGNPHADMTYNTQLNPTITVTNVAHGTGNNQWLHDTEFEGNAHF